MNEATALILQKRIERFFDTADPPVPDDVFAGMLKAMRVDFPASAIGKLPRVTCGDCSDRAKECSRHKKEKCKVCDNWISTAHIHLDYVGHAHLTDRLNEVDPDWDWLPAAFDDDGLPKISAGGNLWIILRFGGRFFQGIGDAGAKKGGDAVKEMIGDALRNVGMRRGAALSLWMKERDVPEGEGDPEAAPSARKAAPAKAAAKKAPAAKAAPAAPAKKAPAAAPEAAPEGDEVAELTALLANVPDVDTARKFVQGRGVNPDTWEGLTPGKVRVIRTALTNMATVAEKSVEKLSTPPAEPTAAKPPAPPAKSPRAALAERAEALPEAWASILKAECIATIPGISGSVGEVVMQMPDDAEWSSWLETWVADAETELAKDPDAVPPGGESF